MFDFSILTGTAIFVDQQGYLASSSVILDVGSISGADRHSAARRQEC